MPRERTPSIIDLALKYDTESKCMELLESMRWPDGPVCPKCECTKAYRIESRMLYECGQCKHQYSATAGTIMHRSHLSLTKWILAAALICNGRKGISACQVARDLHVTYKTAWYLCHRLRRAMRQADWLKKFTGICEMDECYVGGVDRVKHGGKVGRGTKKLPVFGIRERGGEVRLHVMPRITSKNIMYYVKKYVDSNEAMVIADEYRPYDQLNAEFTMERITHSREYVRGEIHTNSIESIWAILQRQVHGTHHQISEQFMPLYLSEICYRFNNRHDPNLYKKVLGNALFRDRNVA